MVNRLAFALLFGLLAGTAQAELRVAEDDGTPAITSRDTLVAFTPKPNELWVIAAQGPLLIDHDTASQAKWQVTPLTVRGGVGVQIKPATPTPWRLRILPWGWKVVEGTAKKLPPVRLNVVKLKDTLKVEGQNVLSAASADGQRYWVLPAAGPVVGGLDTLSGLAVAQNGTLALTQTDLAAPQKNLSPALVAPIKTQAAAPPPPSAWHRLLAKVPVFPAKSLAAVATPAPLVENIEVENTVTHPSKSVVKAVAKVVQAPLQPVANSPMPSDAYRLGSLVPFKLPDDWVYQNGKLIPAEVAHRQQARARAMGSLQVALEQTDKLAARLPVPGEAVSGSLVMSPTMPLVAEAVPEAAQPEDNKTIVWPDVARNTNYMTGLHKLLAALTRAPNARRAMLHEEEAIFNVAWGRGVEAGNALALIPGNLSSRAQFVQALALMEQAKPTDALDKLNALAIRAKAAPVALNNLNIWRAVAQSELGHHAEALKLWPADASMLEDYPQRLRQLAQLDYAGALVAVGNQAEARGYVDTLAKQYPVPVSGVGETAAESGPARLTLLRGLSRLGGKDEKEGLRMLAQAAEQKTDLRTAYQAKFAFVQALQRRGELAAPQYIRYLDELARFWRGDELEAKVLNELGKQYMAARDYRLALTTWRELVRVAPNLPNMADLTDQMTAALLAAFDPESPAAYDPLEYLGMYYDFKELVPADERGDRISERVAELLLQLGLPERARPVAEGLLKYRLKDPVAEGRVALLLAQAQRETGDSAGSLETLDHWHTAMTTTIQQQQWQVAEAKALADLGRLDSAQKALKDRTDAGVQQVKADVAWQRQDWKTLAATLRPVVQTMNPTGVSGSLPLSVVKLAYAETENGDVATLAALQKKWAGVGGDNTAAVFSTLEGTLGVTPSAVLAQQPLGQVASSIAAAEQLTNRIKQEHRQTSEAREERREYDDKMRYMELLPPPRI